MLIHLLMQIRILVRRNEDVETVYVLTNMNAWYNVSVAPKAPLIPPGPMSPVMQQMPSRMPMYAGLLSSAVGAVSTVNSLTPGGFLGQGSGVSNG